MVTNAADAADGDDNNEDNSSKPPAARGNDSDYGVEQV